MKGSKMNTKAKKTSPYINVKRGLYAQVNEGEKKNKLKIALIVLGVLVFAMILITSACLSESSKKNQYIYHYGDTEQKITYESDVPLIDVSAIADYCGASKSLSSTGAIYEINGTEAIFSNGSKIANINGIEITMPRKAVVKNGYCLIPTETAKLVFTGLTITDSKKETTITLNGKTVYIIAKDFDIEYATDLSSYMEYINSKNEYIFTLLNKKNPIDEDFEPETLVDIPEKYRRKDKIISLDRTALKALEAMLEDMYASNITDVFVQSAYRSHAYQDMLFNMYIDREMEENGLSLEAATEKANKYSAKAEFSEHRTGLCVDFSTESIYGAVDDIFETTPAFSWLKENAWKYGFILRYPKEKENVTGYIYESWHYRFVGFEVASVIHQTGLCYEEYLEEFTQ